MDRKSDVFRRKKYGIKGRRPISLVSEILVVIQENENITNRQIKLKVKNLSDFHPQQVPSRDGGALTDRKDH